MVNDPIPSELFMNLYKRNFTRVVVQLGNYYPVVNIAMLRYSWSILCISEYVVFFLPRYVVT